MSRPAAASTSCKPSATSAVLPERVLPFAILMFCPQFRPLIGGAERQAEILAQALAGRGHRVEILTPQHHPDHPLTEEYAGVVVRRFPLFDLHRQFPRLRGLGPLNLLSLRHQVRRQVRARIDAFDVLHAHIASPLTAFAVAEARRAGRPTLCKIALVGARNDLTETLAIGLGGRAVVRSLRENLDRWVLTTRYGRDSFLNGEIPSERIEWIPNGVELPRETPASGKPRTRFLYVGRVSSNIDRDLPSLVKAFDALCARDPARNLELTIVGGGDQLADLKRLVTGCRHADRIALPGEQPAADWLRWADAFILPSRREGLSNALLEAMAHSLPCIANDIPPNREVLADGRAGRLVPVGDVPALTNALARIAGDPAFANEMARAARTHVENVYSIERVAQMYETLYGELVGAGAK